VEKGPKLTDDGPMPDQPAQLLEAIANLLNANQRLRVNLEANSVILKQALSLMNAETDLGDLLHALPSKAQRRAAEETVTNLISARLALGQAIVNASLSAGFSLEDLAERFEQSADEVGAASRREQDHPAPRRSMIGDVERTTEP
jgi:hypothetical protein